ncbi:hypothetical protein [Nocardia thailandica]
MNPALHLLQVVILLALVAVVVAFFVGLVLADLRENPPMLTAVEDEDDAGELSIEDDPGAEWDRARDRDLDFWGAA